MQSSGSNRPSAFITGITGQDGSYLTELLLEKGYDVHGMVRRTSSLIRTRLDHLFNNPEIYNKRLFFHYGDLEDSTSLRRALHKVQPTEVYHLAGQSHVGLSFEMAESTCELTAMGTLRLLEMLRDIEPAPKFFHASSAEIFGHPTLSPQDESTPFIPVTPYGCAKAFATQMAKIFRNTFGLYIVNGIMYNHESPRRGENFVTRKICRAAAAIKMGKQNTLWLGDTRTERDWGHARDFVHGMWLSMQKDRSDDYIFATGQLHRVQDIVEIAFNELQLNWKDHVRQDPRFVRPADPKGLLGNPRKAEMLLGWKREISFCEMIKEMVKVEMTETGSE